MQKYLDTGPKLKKTKDQKIQFLLYIHAPTHLLGRQKFTYSPPIKTLNLKKPHHFFLFFSATALSLSSPLSPPYWVKSWSSLMCYKQLIYKKLSCNTQVKLAYIVSFAYMHDNKSWARLAYQFKIYVCVCVCNTFNAK